MADKNSDKQLASEQSREGPGNGGIPRSNMNVSKRGVKRKLELWKKNKSLFWKLKGSNI